MDIINIKDIKPNMIELCGGKASNLGQLIHLGLSVPKGFVISNLAYKKFLTAFDIKSQLEELISCSKPDNTNFEDIRNMFLSKEFPSEFIHNLKSFIDEMVGCKLAIRSSSVVEDSSENSWAGQFSTFLNIAPNDMMDYVKECWASLFSLRALSYAKRSKIDLLQIGMGVIVQEFLPADKSGIAFTKHPVDDDDSVILIEASYGLGEGIVSGKITPDSYQVNKKNLKVVDSFISDQALKVAPCIGQGTTTITVEKDLQKLQKLTEDEIKLIATKCLEIEEFFRCSQDIEFCIVGDSLYFLQSRPITT